jgi:hypothetical protein
VTDVVVGSGALLGRFFIFRKPLCFEAEFIAEVPKHATSHLIAVDQAIAATRNWISFVATFEGKTKHSRVQVIHLAIDLRFDGAKIDVATTAGGNLQLRWAA